jgi:arabinan endo-1,5-alpha-L-arabinosidase
MISFTRARTIDTPRYSSTPYPSQREVRPFLKAMCISAFPTLATFLPLLFHLGLTSPIPQNDSAQALAQVSFPDPAPSSGNISWIHDPSIIYEGGTYWRFSTSGNIAVATAPSITGPWTYQGALLREGTKIQVAPNQDVWASCPFHSSAEQY